MKSPAGQTIELVCTPVHDVYITQPFGVNYLDFYTKMGMKGHNGIDFRAYDGCPIIASHDGYVTWAGIDGDGGISVNLTKSLKGLSFYTLNYHLKAVNVAVGEEIKAGSLIGWADNTGKYTTASHDHYGLKEVIDGGTINMNNGYKGAIDPSPYFPKNWDKPPAYHRYGRRGNALADFWFRFTPLGIKNQWTEGGRWVQRHLKARKLPLLNTEQVNAILYGAWPFEQVINPAMRINYAYLTYKQFTDGKRPFC